jgi:hypothetical protein
VYCSQSGQCLSWPSISPHEQNRSSTLPVSQSHRRPVPSKTNTFTLADGYVGEFTPLVVDIFDAIAPETGSALSGIIGQDFMRRYVVTFDYTHNIISFA